MNKLTKGLIISLPVLVYFGIFQLPYFVWTFALTQNWLTENGLITFKDIIYHHTPLPLFALFIASKFLGNTAEMLRISSFVLAVIFGYGIYLTGRQFSKKVGTFSLILFFISFFPLFHNFHIEEMLASLLTVYSVYFFLKFFQKKRFFYLFATGLFATLGLMSKQAVIGIFLSFFIALFLYFKNDKKLSVNLLKKSSILIILGVIVGITPFLIYYIRNNALADFYYWNVVFNLTIYPQQSIPYALKEGLINGGWLIFAIIPGIILLNRQKLEKELYIKIFFITLAAIFTLPSILPSFLIYKFLPFYPYPLIIWAIIMEHMKNKNLRFSFIIGIIFFSIPAKAFYIDYLPQDFLKKDYILDYGKNELAVVEWLKNNTPPKEPIMNLGNHYILTLSKRLPANKYVYLFPWLVMPYEISTRNILKEPPHTVIIDNQTISDFPILNKWPFLSYLKKNYKVVAKYGTYEIFTFQNP